MDVWPGDKTVVGGGARLKVSSSLKKKKGTYNSVGKECRFCMNRKPPENSGLFVCAKIID